MGGPGSGKKGGATQTVVDCNKELLEYVQDNDVMFNESYDNEGLKENLDTLRYERESEYKELLNSKSIPIIIKDLVAHTPGILPRNSTSSEVNRLLKTKKGWFGTSSKKDTLCLLEDKNNLYNIVSHVLYLARNINKLPEKPTSNQLATTEANKKLLEKATRRFVLFQKTFRSKKPDTPNDHFEAKDAAIIDLIKDPTQIEFWSYNTNIDPEDYNHRLLMGQYGLIFGGKKQKKPVKKTTTVKKTTVKKTTVKKTNVKPATTVKKTNVKNPNVKSAKLSKNKT